jgi:hypothetical protein
MGLAQAMPRLMMAVTVGRMSTYLGKGGGGGRGSG